MTDGPDYRASVARELQPYRWGDEVVTLTPQQCNAIYHALGVWLQVAPDTPNNTYVRQGVEAARTAFWQIGKSCLLGRLLYDGRPPLVDPPPVRYGAPDYSVEETADDRRTIRSEGHPDRHLPAGE